VIETSCTINCSNNVSCQRNEKSKFFFDAVHDNWKEAVCGGNYRKHYKHLVFPLFVDRRPPEFEKLFFVAAIESDETKRCKRNLHRLYESLPF
jgi:hypothetical protein